MVYVFEGSELAAPCSIIQLPRRVFDCLHLSSRIDCHFLEAWFQRAIITLDIAAFLCIHLYEIFDFRYALNLGWPVELAEWVRPPAFCSVPDGPSDAVVGNRVIACLLEFLVEIRKVLFLKLVYARVYCSRAPT